MITISDGILTIPEGERFVGFSGDNLHTQKKFFIRNNTQSGWLYRLYLTFDDSSHNFFLLPSTVSDEGTFLTWDIEEGHIFKSGLIKAQIKAFSKEKEVYHTTSDVFVAGLSTEEDEDFKNSNSEFLSYEKRLNELYLKMQEASAKMPYVGTNGNWFTYDISSNTYVDSGIPSNLPVEGGAVTPELLDREYWQKNERNPVMGYEYFDSILNDYDAVNTFYRIEFSGLSPVKAVVGEGSFAAITRRDLSGLLLINITNGESWVYEKGSLKLTPCNNSGALEDGAVTPEKLDRDYWQKNERIPVVGYDYFDSILNDYAAVDTFYRIEFSGFSPVKAVVGEGSFAAITRRDLSGLLLINITNGDRWIYEKGSGELVKCDGNESDFVCIGHSMNDMTQLRAYPFEEGKIYYFTLQAVLGVLTGGSGGYCYGRYYREEENEILDIFKHSDLSNWRINLTEGTIEPLTGIQTNEYSTTGITLSSDKEYRFTSDNLRSLTLALPSLIPVNFECSLVFKSGDTAAQLNCPSTVKWSGDDVASVTNVENDIALTYNCLVPQKNKTYNVIFWYDGFNVNAVARGVSNE